MFRLVVLGVLMHWLWELAVEVIATAEPWEFGSFGIVAARIVENREPAQASWRAGSSTKSRRS